MTGPRVIERTAVFSPNRAYRYQLWRRFDNDRPATGFAMFVGLNPSTADETADDPTVRRCIRYAWDWGFDGLVMTNIFAFRATDPAVMKLVVEPVGPENDATLVDLAQRAGIVVAAWGTHGSHRGRGVMVWGRLRRVCRLHVLKLTKDGAPAHPLYLRANLEPEIWHAT